MSEKAPRISDSETTDATPSRRRRIIGAVSAAALTAAVAVTVGVAANKSDEAPKPAAATAQREAGGGESPEMAVQGEVRQDAAAILRGVGSLLKNTGQTVASGRAVDNYGNTEVEVPMEGAPGLQVVRNNEGDLLNVTATTAARDKTFTMQLRVDRRDPLMSDQPLDAEGISHGPADLTYIDPMSFIGQNPDGSSTEVFEVGGHLVYGNPETGKPLTLDQSAEVGRLALGTLEGIAGDLGEQLPQDVVDELEAA